MFEITYGTAFVNDVDIGTDNQGVVTDINGVVQGRFSEEAIGDISRAGRNLLVFVHGFDNTFSDAITRAAFNWEWLAASHVALADMAVVAFSWPSKGQLIGFPFLDSDYRFDQQMARNSGLHLMAFLENLSPILRVARRAGQRAVLLAHSMGNLALQSAVENWFLHGNGDDKIFDVVLLAAGDCEYDTFGQPNLGRLSGLTRLADRVSIYYSHADEVLQLSRVVNLGAQRLGQDGPRDRSDTTLFPAEQYQMVDCTQYRDYKVDFLTSHQYYRQSPEVRSLIVAAV